MIKTINKPPFVLVQFSVFQIIFLSLIEKWYFWLVENYFLKWTSAKVYLENLN